MKKERKSPLKGKLLRRPGQSIDEKIVEMVHGDAALYLLAIVFSIVLACLEWWRWFYDMPYSPLAFTGVAIVVSLVGIYKIIKIKRELESQILGRNGEIEVGQQLDNLKAKGYKVFHDLVGDNFNIDHVVVCEHGVFTVETKTISRPEKGSVKIVVQTETVFVDGYPNNEIVIQAKAEANFLCKLLREATEKEISVQPSVLFPGWYVDSIQATDAIWFLNPDQLKALIRNRKKVFSRDEVVMLSHCISQYIQNK